MYLKDKISG